MCVFEFILIPEVSSGLIILCVCVCVCVLELISLDTRGGNSGKIIPQIINKNQLVC